MEWLSRRFELSRGGGAHNMRPMEGLRGFAVFLVFLVHYVTLVKPWIAHAPRLEAVSIGIHALGNSGVDLFFVLSGFLIYGSLIRRPQSFIAFMRRRIHRIYPTFTTVFLIYIALSFVFKGENKIPASVGAGAIYLAQNFFLLPGIFPIEPMITVAWSLSYEIFYYVAIPFVIAVFGLRRRSSAWRAVFFMVAAGFLTGICAVYGGPVRLIMFISGILLSEAILGKLVPIPSALVGSTALCIGLLITLLPLAGTLGFAVKISTLFISFFLVCLACFAMPTEWLPRFFSWTLMRWLGNMSYSYYLLHGLALKAIFLVLKAILPAENHADLLFWALLPTTFVLTLLPTAALFLLVERPFSLGSSGSKRADTNLMQNAVEKV